MSVGRSRVCRWALGIYVVTYLAALAILAIATFGLFGQPRDPLGAVYLLPLGLPWNLLIEPLPEPLWPWLAALAPALNIALLGGFCRWRGRQPSAGNRRGGTVGHG